MFTSPERERRRLQAEQARIAREQLRDEARLAKQQRHDDAKAERERANELRAEQKKRRGRSRDEQDRKDSEDRWKLIGARWCPRAQVVGRLAVMSVTNLGVNLVAVGGQYMVFIALGVPAWAAATGAAIVESVAVYVSWHAHVALREGDAAWGLRMRSYLIGAAAAWLSYTHVPETPELFAACSLISPWLWAMHSRHLHRKDLREAGLIDPRAPKFSPLRWALHTGETFAAFRWAIGEGVQSPQTAVAVVRERRAVRMTWASVEDTRTAVIAAQRATVELTLTHMAALTQELYGADPDAVKAVEEAKRFINRVGAGLVPRYVPQLVRELEAGDGGGPSATNGADGPHAKWWTRMFRPAGTGADEKGDGADEKADEKPRPQADERADGADGKGDEKPDEKLAPRGRRTGGRRTNPRTVRVNKGGPSARTSKPSAAPESVDDLMPLGLRIAGELEKSSVRLTRDNLRAAVQATGQPISNDRTGLLLKRLRAEAPNGRTGADESRLSARTVRAANGGPSATRIETHERIVQADETHNDTPGETT
ncbi:hypothetical protein [Streptosporangium sp. NPDC001681]|uniref:hypothetical protein n=1 Tax=Streptosporangium sp. NPDC001681 TaxID=3154395 RepID=UPI003333712D